MSTITLIAALSDNRVIGRGGGLPWHLPADLKRFKALTMGHAIVMGRRTWDAVGRPLPGRRTIVLTRRHDFEASGAVVVHDLEAALAAAGDDDTVFIAGGGDIYALALPRADRMELTHVHAVLDGDAFFPPFDAGAWRTVFEQRHEADERHAFAFTFRTLERVVSPRPRPGS